MKNVIISGTSNVIGENLVKFFLKKKYTITIFNSKDNEIKSLDKFNFNNNFNKLNAKKTIAIHAAGKSRFFFNKKTSFLRANYLSTINFLKFINNKKIKKFYFISTVAVFNIKNDVIINSKTPISPSGDYGLSKLMAENFVKKFCKKNNINFSLIRIPAIYSNQTKNKYKFLKLCVKFGIPIPIINNEIKRSYLNIKFFVKKFNKIILNKKNKKIYYIADKINYSLLQIFQIIFEKKIKNYYILPNCIIKILSFFYIDLKISRSFIISKKLKF